MHILSRLDLRRGVLALGIGVLAMFSLLGGQPDNEGNQDRFITFIEAVRMGDLAVVESCLREGADINQLGGNVERGHRYPALFHALHARQGAAAELLIERGADVITPIEKRAPFSWAADFGNVEIALRIWAKLPAGEQRRLLEENDSWVGALEFGYLDAVKELQTLGFSLEGKDGGATALHAAVASGRVDHVEYVLTLGISPNGRKAGATALARAAGQNYLEIMERLLARGAEVDAICPQLPDVTYWFKHEVTALVAAVIKGEPEAVALLLKHGANPAALDNRAIRWADLLGDEESFRMLRNAGAPEPVAFSFRDWLSDAKAVRGEPKRGGRDVLADDLTMMLASAPTATGEKPTALTRPTKLAIVSLSPGLEGAEGVLATHLSELDGATLLERTDVRRIVQERKLEHGFGGLPSENKSFGSLLGADALVLLQLSKQGDQTILETRVVGVSTGLVTSMQLSAWDKKSLESWVDATVRQCAADVSRIFTAPRDVKLVTVMPLLASTSGIDARETESRLTLLLASQLARLPGVFLLERRELDRLSVEAGAADKALLNSSWLISGSIEVMGVQAGREAENSLSLKLDSGLRGAVQNVRISGVAHDPQALVRATVKEIGEVMAVQTDIPWDPLSEAGAYFEKGRAFAERRMWTEAQAATEAAWALGLQTDAVARQRVYTRAKRALFAANRVKGKRRGPIWVKDFTGNQRGVTKGVTMRDVIIDRAPVMVHSGDDRELSVEDYLELSGEMLDLLARRLREGEFSEKDFQAWVVSPVWDAATLPLQLGEALSYQHHYDAEFGELRARLLEVNEAALQMAKERGFKTEQHTLWGLRCRLLSSWLTREAQFQDEILKVLHEAREARPAVSGHPVWGSVHKSGQAQMDVIGGRASQAWVRLARNLVKSDDLEERLLGLAWLCKEVPPASAEVIGRRVKQVFTAVLERDYAWTGSIWDIANDVSREPGSLGRGLPAGPWYENALRASIGSQVKISIAEGYWDVSLSKGLRHLPEERAFKLASFERKTALMKAHGGSCLLRSYGDSDELSDEELQRLFTAIRKAAPLIDAVVKLHPEARNYYMEPGRWIGWFTDEVADRNFAERLARTSPLKFGTPRWLFPEENDAQIQTLAIRGNRIDGFGYRADGDIWWKACSERGDATFFRFSPDGEVIDGIVHLREAKDGAFYLGEASNRSVNGGVDVTEHYLAVQARDVSRRGRPRFNDCVRLYDRLAGEWTTLISPFPTNMICDIRILSGNVYFSFLYNSEVEKTEVMGLSDFARRGEPTWGIAEYDISEKSYRLLASSRRDPAESPWDGGGKEYRDLIRVSSTTLAVGGMPGWVYDLAERVWRKSTSDDVSEMKKASAPLLEIEAGGGVWVHMRSGGEKIVFSPKNRNSGKTPIWIKIPVELDMRTAGEGVDQALVRRVGEVRGYRYHGTPHGIALSGDGFYAWVPLSEVKPVLEEAVRRLTE